MQVFNAFIRIMKKRLPMVYMWIGICLMVALMMTQSSPTKEFSDTVLKVCVFDEDNTEASRALKEFIGTKHDIREIENDNDKILDSLYYSRINYVLTINSGYEEKIKNGNTDDLFTNRYVHSNYGNMLMTNLTENYVRSLSAYLAGGNDLETALKNTENALSSEIEVSKETFNEKAEYSAGSSDRSTMYFQFIPYGILQIMISALCPVILTVSKKDVKNRTDCSCMKSSSYSLQIILGSVIFVVCVWIVFMIAGLCVNGGSVPAYAIANSFIFTLISAGIALFISSLAPNQAGVNVLANIVSIGMSFLCGVFVPQSMLGSGVLNAARFLPAYWYIKANDMISGVSGDIFSQGTLMKYFGIEVLFAAVFFIGSAAVIKVKHDKA